MTKAFEYGKSICGWYCSFLENGMFDELHAQTYRELLRRCKICNVSLKGATRIDH